MPDLPITGLTELVSPSSGDMIPIVDVFSGVTKKVRFDAFGGGGAGTAGDGIDITLGVVSLDISSYTTDTINVTATSIATYKSDLGLYLVGPGGTSQIYIVPDELFLGQYSPGPDIATQLRFNTSTGVSTFESSYATTAGLEYGADYSANFTARSLVDKGYVTGLAGAYLPLAGGTMSGDILFGSAVKLKSSINAPNFINIDFFGQMDISSSNGISIYSTSGSNQSSILIDDTTLQFRTPSHGGIKLYKIGVYDSDFTASMTGNDRMIPDIGKVNSLITAGVSGTYLPLAGGTMSGNILFTGSTGIDTTSAGASDTLNIGATNADIINIGRTGAVVNIIGTTLYENVTNLQVTDKLITLNKGGAASSGTGVGFEIEENSVITGYFKSDTSRNGFSLKACSTAGVATLITPSASATYTLPAGGGTFAMAADLAGYVLTSAFTAFKNAPSFLDALGGAYVTISDSGTQAEIDFINTNTLFGVTLTADVITTADKTVTIPNATGTILLDPGSPADTYVLTADSTLPGVLKYKWAAVAGGGGTVTSVSGTTNRITVATGTTTPVIDISASYVGQTSITTLGTLTTGATGAGFTVALTTSTVSGLLLGVNGGTGVANSGKTITLGGNLTTSGAFATTLTATATTSVTLPTTGTLSTLAGAETFTQKVSYNGLVITADTGVVTTGTWSAGTILANRGGTGFASYAVGDLLYADTTSTLAKLADVSAGSYLRSGGVTTALLWSTTKLLNAGTANYVKYWGSTNTEAESANLQFDGSNLGIGVAPTKTLHVNASNPIFRIDASTFTNTVPNSYGGAAFTGTTTFSQISQYGTGGVWWIANSGAANTPAISISAITGITGALTTQPGIILSANKLGTTGNPGVLAATDWLFALENGGTGGVGSGTKVMSVYGNGNTRFTGSIYVGGNVDPSAQMHIVAIASAVGLRVGQTSGTADLLALYSATPTKLTNFDYLGRLFITNSTASGTGTGALVVTGGISAADITIAGSIVSAGGNFFSTNVNITDAYFGRNGSLSGTNLGGGSLMIQSGLGTGNATGSIIELRTPTPRVTSDSTDQTLVARMRVNAFGIYIAASADTASASNNSLVNDAGVLKWKDNSGVLNLLY